MTDLHIHSTFSDGTDSVEEILRKLKSKNIKYFSITDHNNFESILALQNLPYKYDINYLPGIEFSCTYYDKEYHVLAYGKIIDHQQISYLCNLIQQERIYSDKKFIEKIIGSKRINEYENYIHNPLRGGWKALNYLLDKEVISSKKDFFDIYDACGIKPVFISPNKLIKILQRQNLTTILAHPTKYQSDNLMSQNELTQWKQWGINGIEVYTQYYDNKDEINYYHNFCIENDLIITGGSDYHGAFHSVDIGDIELKDNSCIKLLKNEFIQI